MKRIVFFLFSIFLACNTNLHAQENKDIDKYKEFLDYAHQSFNSGDYDKAKTHLTAYKKFTSDSASVHNLEQQIELCIEIKNNAREAERKGDYSKALGYYLSLRRNNPEDLNILGEIALLQKLITQMTQTGNPVKKDVYSIGDEITIGNKSGRIAYLDATKKHGLAIIKTSRTPCKNNEIPIDYSDTERIPTINELKVIYDNKGKLGLFEKYWSSTVEKKDNQWRTYYMGFYLDFNSGKVGKTKLSKSEIYCYIVIKDF